MKIPVLIYLLVLFGLSIFSQETFRYTYLTGDLENISLNIDSREFLFMNASIDLTEYTPVIVPDKFKDQRRDIYGLDRCPDYMLVNRPVNLNQDEIGQYNGHEYEYYENLYKGSRTMQVVGILFTAAGAGMMTAGILIGSRPDSGWDDSGQITGLLLVGSIACNVGIPLLVAGSIKKANNRKAMKEVQKQNELSINFSGNGIGMVFKF